MNITLISAGSRGDIAPFAALATGLQAAGHETTLLAHDEFVGLLGSSGVRFFPARGRNPREVLDSPEGRKLLENAKSPRGYAREFRKLVEPVIDTAFEDSLEASEGADLVVYAPMAFGAFNAAEKLDIPSIQLQLQPLLASKRYPTVFSQARSLGPIGNRISHAMGERVLSDAIREPLNRARASVMGLEPRTAKNLIAEQRLREPAPILAFDELLVPRPSDWPGGAVQCGALMLTGTASPAPSAELEAFLAEGPAMYFGFGSMLVDDPEGIVEAIASVTQDLGLRAVVQRGWGGFAPPGGAPHLLFVDEVDHARLFPRMSAIVHHGGAGTTAQALRSGRPSLVVPIMGDQFFWGHRGTAAGIGPSALPASRVSAATLKPKVAALVGEERYAHRAADIARELSQTDPLAAAISAVEAAVPLAVG